MAARVDGRPLSENSEKAQVRLNQIISHFHTKAALAICSARATLKPITLQSGEAKQDRWFNLLLDDTESLQEDLYEWRRHDQATKPAPPLQIETYLDTTYLNSSQALVLVDDVGKRWDVADALASSAESSPHLTKNGARHCEVVLERWTIQLGDARGFTSDELNDALPNIYKKLVIFFRSLYTILRMRPAFKLYRKLSRQAGNLLKMKFRLRRQGGGVARGKKDSLRTPLCSSEHQNDSVVEMDEIPPVLTPCGPLRCSLEYRQNCAFTVADAESLLSSRFLGLDEGIPTLAAGRSLPSSHPDRARERYSRTVGVGGDMSTRERPRGLLGAYGSLGTFHAPEKAGSPVSELRQRAEQADEEEDEARSRRNRAIAAGSSRRVSLSLRDNPPFKAGSLASSPKPSSPRPSPSPSTSAGNYDSSFLQVAGTPTSEAAKRIPPGARPQQLPRNASSIPNETAVASSGSASPRPAPVKYSSSFANRHKRLTSQGSKTADSGASSGRGSSSSKEKSGQLNEAVVPPGSSSSAVRSDDDDIAAFISQIETAKELKSFRPPSSSSSTAAAAAAAPGNRPPADQPHTINLAKFSSLRETNALLAEEMLSSSSLLIHQPSSTISSSNTPPSRRLSNVPGLSTSSSPSRAQPHVPFVRSRLSTHSIAEETPVLRSAGAASGSGSAEGVGGVLEREGESQEVEAEEEEDDEPFIFQQDNV